MKISIFSRLVVGCCALLILLTGASLYSVTQLSRVRDVTSSIASVDNRLVDIQKKLADILLSEIRNEKKYLIMKDMELYKGFVGATGDFEKELGTALFHSEEPELISLLQVIKQLHDQYISFFHQNYELARNGKKISEDKYANESKAITDKIFGELEALRAFNQEDVIKKIRKLEEAENKSREIALVMTASSLLLGIMLSLWITRSITAPIYEMKKKTKEIASGIFKDNLKIQSPPEIRDLACAFNSMINSLSEARGQLRDREAELYEANGRLTIEIAEVKKTREELRQLTAELERSNTDLQQFAYAASHDLQEPLRVIAGFTNLLERRYRGKLDEKADDYIGYIIDGVSRMSMLIKDLLDYARVDTQGRTFELTDCNTALGEALSNLQRIIEESGARIFHDSLPVIKADGVQLASLFQNLIGNAIKFRGDNLPEIHISAVRNGNEQVFFVRDNGIGIEDQYAGRIFDVFGRLHARDEYEGSGIGLAICKRIVERHGGKIWVESEPGMGSTFYFTIPERGQNILTAEAGLG